MASITWMDNFHTWAGNFQRNVEQSVSKMTLNDYIRITILLGGYCLLRPYLLQLAGRFQAKDHDRELDPDEMSSAAAVSPNSLRGQVQVPEDSEEEEEGRATTGTDWGRNARRRQRQMIRRILEAEDKLKAEAEPDSDKEIEEFLVESMVRIL
ncbi:MAG: hypothetical protein M1830_010581 [Pleopsidium flavum]|nr:MAG: hypothetical protein M1830_010581 [Pleopsidium flavum]